MEPQRSAPLKASRHHSTRSRDENQERAYTAASRRTDRSIEARLQSAHKASELHKKRTGKALRITEQIVFNDETYEEEDGRRPSFSSLPSRPVLGPMLQTPSADFNSRVEAYLEQKMAMSSFVAAADRQQNRSHGWGEIDRLFAESFPNAAQMARRLAEDMKVAPGPGRTGLGLGLGPGPGLLPADHQSSAGQGGQHLDTASCAEPSSMVAMPRRQAGVDDMPPARGFDHVNHHVDGFSGCQNPDLHDSAFTSDLPPEVLLFLGHEGDEARGYSSYFDDGLKGRHDASYGGFANAGTTAFCLDSDTQKDVGSQDPAMWNYELDAYLDSTAWLGPP